LCVANPRLRTGSFYHGKDPLTQTIFHLVAVLVAVALELIRALGGMFVIGLGRLHRALLMIDVNLLDVVIRETKLMGLRINVTISTWFAAI
jgi:hypothetical protein